MDEQLKKYDPNDPGNWRDGEPCNRQWDTYDGYTKLCREINMVPMPYKLWEQVNDWHVAHGNYEER